MSYHYPPNLNYTELAVILGIGFFVTLYILVATVIS